MTKDESWLLEEKYGGVRTPECEADCARLQGGEPVAYVIGTQPFLGLTIYLDSKPLIPRPETEWWVERALGEGIVGESRVLDLCAGSGAIGCAALKYLPHAHVYFGEIDPAHESTIYKNIRENHLDASRADVRVGDLVAPFVGMTFDLILANPPYIPESRELDLSVADHEPSLALRSGPHGLDLMRRLARELRTFLAPNGVAYIECDSEHAEEARTLFAAAGFSATLHTDPYDRPRVIVVR